MIEEFVIPRTYFHAWNQFKLVISLFYIPSRIFHSIESAPIVVKYHEFRTMLSTRSRSSLRFERANASRFDISQRSLNLTFNKASVWRMSIHYLCFCAMIDVAWHKRDSISRPPGNKGDALPLSYRHMQVIYTIAT